MDERSATHRVLAVIAGLLGALAIAVGDPYLERRGDATERSVASVTAVDLARWLRDRRRGVRLIDVRSDSQFVAYHIPAAEHVRTSALSRRRWSAGDTIVIYAEDDAAAERASRVLRARGVDARILGGGLLRWIEQIAEPRLAALPPTATAAERAARREHLELSRYFGGLPVVSPVPAATAANAAPAPVTPRRSEASAVARMLRRGC